MKSTEKKEAEGSSLGDRLGSVVHAEFGVYGARVSLDGVQRNEKPRPHVPVAESLADETKHFELAFAQRLEQFGFEGSGFRSEGVLGLSDGECSQQTAHVLWPDPPAKGLKEQTAHRGAFVHEDPHEAFRFGNSQDALETAQSAGDVTRRLIGQRLQHQKLYHTRRPSALPGDLEQARHQVC
jgi:hypothetical protein